MIGGLHLVENYYAGFGTLSASFPASAENGFCRFKRAGA